MRVGIIGVFVVEVLRWFFISLVMVGVHVRTMAYILFLLSVLSVMGFMGFSSKPSPIYGEVHSLFDAHPDHKIE